MRFALASLQKDIARWRQDYLATLVWISIPLLIGGLITSLMGPNARPHGTLLLVDEDQTFLSEVVGAAYGLGGLGEILTVEKTSYDAGLARVDSGDASGLLVIPSGFARAFAESEPVTLILRTNPEQRVLPGIITNVTEVVLDAGFYAHQLVRDDIVELGADKRQPTDNELAAFAATMQERLKTVAPRLFPPIIDIDIVAPAPAEPAPPLALLFMPGVILMAVMFSANGLAGDFWRERELGTLRRLVSAPSLVGGFLAGKALAAAAVIAVVAGVTLVIGFLYHGIAWSKLLPAVAWTVLSGVGLFAWFAALQMHFNSQKTASVFSTVLVFPLLMAGGSFFPLAVMPGWMAVIGRAAPNGFVADRLTTEITAAGAWAIDPASWIGVAAVTAAGLSLCAWRLRTGFARA